MERIGSSVLLTITRQDLDEIHVSMISFSACVGVGLFLQSGRVIYLTGPGLAFIAYLITGTVMWSAVACLGEMTALCEINAFSHFQKVLSQ